MNRKTNLHPSLATLAEIGVLFLPAIPAYLWMWPRVEGLSLWVMQVLAYLYVLAGTLWISVRHWTLRELGFTRKGMGMSLVCGLLIILGRTFIILSVEWDLNPPLFNLWRVLGELVFYFGLVGLVEEWLFRGLVYHSLETWRGTNSAIWGSSLGFMLWHIFGQGPLIGLATLFYGLIFALIRWRAGGIVGLIFVHGLMDFVAAQMLPSTDVLGLGRPEIPFPLLLILGCVLLLSVPFYLWLVYPRMHKFNVRFLSEEV